MQKRGELKKFVSSLYFDGKRLIIMEEKKKEKLLK